MMTAGGTTGLPCGILAHDMSACADIQYQHTHYILANWLSIQPTVMRWIELEQRGFFLI